MPALPGQNLRLPTGDAYDRLTPLQRRAMVGAIAAAHVAALWALLQIREVREAVADAAPIFVSLVAPPTPPEVTPPPPPPPPTPPVRRPIAPEPRLIAAAPSPAPKSFVVAPPPEPTPPEPAPVVAAAPVAPPAPPPPPRNLSASAVQYLEPLQVEYPRLSKRARRDGRGHAARLHRRGGSRSRCPGQSHIGSPPSRRRGHGSGAEGALQAAQRERSGGIRVRPGAGRFSIGEMT